MRVCMQEADVVKGLLTARLRVRVRILELLEGGVGGNGVSHVLCPLLFEHVVRETANEGRGKVLKGPDTFGLAFRL